MSEQSLDVQTTGKKSLSIKASFAYLAEKFPLCFSVEGEAKPLKVGIFQDLADALADDETLSKTQLRQVLRAYTMNWRYLHACKEGAVRVGLQGEEAGVIDAAQAEHAAKTLQEAKAAYAERKAAEQREKRKAERKAFFKNQAREQRKQETKNEAPKASLESLAALESKFSKEKK